MRYKAKQYAEAFTDALADAERAGMPARPSAFAESSAGMEAAQALTRRFVELLTRHRMLAQAGRIIKAAERLLAKRAGVRRIALESASVLPQALREELAGIFGGAVWLSERVRPDLLAGVRILIDDETLIDASGKHRLAEIFQKTRR